MEWGWGVGRGGWMDRMGRLVSLTCQTLPLRCYYCVLQLSNNSSAKIGAGT